MERILAAIDRGEYRCIGLSEQGEVVGYAYFVVTGPHLLFDYLAVLPQHRNHGLGSAFLRLLSGWLSEAESTILEVEDPDFTGDPMAQRRLQFYLRSGFQEAGVSAHVFGVHYRLLIPTDGKELTSDEVKALYCAHYRRVLPPAMYEKFIYV